MMYHQMPIPPRSEHLWRYTPWHRIHPSTTDVVPSADGILFKTDSDVSLVEKSLGSKIMLKDENIYSLIHQPL